MYTSVCSRTRQRQINQKRHAGQLLVVWALVGKAVVRGVAWVAGRVLYWRFSKTHPNAEDRRKFVLAFMWKGRVVLLVMLGLATAFVVTHLEEVPISGRKRLLWVNQEGVKELGVLSAGQFKEALKDQILPHSDPRHKRIAALVERLVKSMRSMPELADREKALDLSWDVNVVETKDFNAFVLPNGSIFVFTGFMQVSDSYDQSDDTLAAMLGHEMSHALLQHSAEQASRQPFVDSVNLVLLTTLWFCLPFGFESLLSFTNNTAEGVVSSLMELPNSRTCEHEADLVGMRIAASACHDPRKGTGFWKHVVRLGFDGGGASFLSTHPPSDERAENLEKDSPQTLELYRSSKMCQHLREIRGQQQGGTQVAVGWGDFLSRLLSAVGR